MRLGLDLLAPEDSDLIIEHHWEGRSFGEIGERLGISPDAVRMRHVREGYRNSAEPQSLISAVVMSSISGP